jgi:hypothetical protein
LAAAEMKVNVDTPALTASFATRIAIINQWYPYMGYLHLDLAHRIPEDVLDLPQEDCETCIVQEVQVPSKYPISPAQETCNLLLIISPQSISPHLRPLRNLCSSQGWRYLLFGKLSESRFDWGKPVQNVKSRLLGSHSEVPPDIYGSLSLFRNSALDT